MSFNIQHEFRTSQARWPKSGEIRYTFTRRDQRSVAQKVYNAIHWINLYPVDSATGLSGGINAGSCPGFEPGLMGSYWCDRPLLSSKTQMLFLKDYWTPTEIFSCWPDGHFIACLPFVWQILPWIYFESFEIQLASFVKTTSTVL